MRRVGEFRHVGAADGNEPGGAKACHRHRVTRRRSLVGQNRRCGRGDGIGQVKHVFDGDWDARPVGERPSCLTHLVDPIRGQAGRRVIHRDERLAPLALRIGDAFETGFDQLPACYTARRQVGGEFSQSLHFIILRGIRLRRRTLPSAGMNPAVRRRAPTTHATVVTELARSNMSLMETGMPAQSGSDPLALRISSIQSAVRRADVSYTAR